jgi:hypothetical protein
MASEKVLVPSVSDANKIEKSACSIRVAREHKNRPRDGR